MLSQQKQECDGTDNWNQFSCLHSTMTDEWNFVVYTGSHRLEESAAVNPLSRIELRFPKDGSYFIVWHGRLVHSGASSIVGKSGNALKSARMFSYLRVPEHNTQFNGNNRRSTRLKTYTVKLKDDTVDTSSFSMMKGQESNLFISLPSNKEFIKNKHSIIEPILGNMNQDGWEIYNGIDFSRLPTYTSDLNMLLSKRYKHFKGISGSQRKTHVLTTLECYESGIMEKATSIYTAYENLLVKKLQKIPYLVEVEMYYKSLLANFDHVGEQNQHRDFWSVKKPH